MTAQPDQWISYRGYTLTPEDRSVYAAALERIRDLFALPALYVVSFSGGKDSTCVLELSLEVARELGKLPLRVAFFDEEILDPDTLAYVEQVRARPEIALDWFCVPLRHTLRSKGRTHWFTWDPACRDQWARRTAPSKSSSASSLVTTGDRTKQHTSAVLSHRTAHPYPSVTSDSGLRTSDLGLRTSDFLTR